MPCFEPVMTTAVGEEKGRRGRSEDKPWVTPRRLVAKICGQGGNVSDGQSSLRHGSRLTNLRAVREYICLPAQSTPPLPSSL